MLHDLLNLLESGLLDRRQGRGRAGCSGHAPGRDSFLADTGDIHHEVFEGEVHPRFLQKGDCKHPCLLGLRQGRYGEHAGEAGHPARQGYGLECAGSF